MALPWDQSKPRDQSADGTIPAAIGSLYALTSLGIMCNPGLIGTLPESIGKLTALKAFGLVLNGVSGTIPDAIRHLTALMSLFIVSNTGLVGTIPNTIGELTALEALKVSSNSKLSGTIPSIIGELPNLKVLLLNNNSFTAVGAGLCNLADRFLKHTHTVCDFSNNSFPGDHSGPQADSACPVCLNDGFCNKASYVLAYAGDGDATGGYPFFVQTRKLFPNKKCTHPPCSCYADSSPPSPYIHTSAELIKLALVYIVLAAILFAFVMVVVFEIVYIPIRAARDAFVRRAPYGGALRYAYLHQCSCFSQMPCCAKCATPTTLLLGKDGFVVPWMNWRRAREANDVEKFFDNTEPVNESGGDFRLLDDFFMDDRQSKMSNNSDAQVRSRSGSGDTASSFETAHTTATAGTGTTVGRGIDHWVRAGVLPTNTPYLHAEADDQAASEGSDDSADSVETESTVARSPNFMRRAMGIPEVSP